MKMMWADTADPIRNSGNSTFSVEKERFRYTVTVCIENMLDPSFDTAQISSYGFDTQGFRLSHTSAYCRVSTADQTPDSQLYEITSAGFAIDPRRVVMETVSGSTAAMERAGFKSLVNKLDSDDVSIATKLDRLGRNAMDVRATVEALAAEQVRVHCLALGGVDLTSAAGKMTMAVIAAVAESERDLLIERTRAGLTRAKADGKKLGRPSILSDTQRETIRTKRAAGVSLGALAKEFDVSRSAIQRASSTGQ